MEHVVTWPEAFTLVSLSVSAAAVLIVFMWRSM